MEGFATQNVILVETTTAKAFKNVEARIVKNSLDVIVLKAIKDEPLNGYAIIQLIYRKFGVQVSAGTMYPLLSSLEKKGLVTSNGEKTRTYRLTENGEKSLKLIAFMQNRIKMLNNDIF